MVGEFSAHASHENDISWDDFKEGFRGAHIPKSIMKIKKREFDVLGNVVISKKFLRTRKIMAMHSNERGECCLRTLVD